MGSEVQEKGGAHDRARIVRRYLSALDARKPGRTTARVVESVLHRMHQIDTLLLSADPVRRLHLTQERIDLHAEQLRLQTANGDFDALEKAFIRVARSYGERYDVTYSAWRQVGVDADVLAKAGIHQQAKPPRPQVGDKAAAPAAAPATEAPAAPAPTAETKAPAAPAPTAETKAENKPDAKPADKKPAPPKKAPAAKKATGDKPADKPADTQPAVAKKTAASSNGAGAKKAAVKKKAADNQPEQQQLPAEAHLLS
jgi:hypothetical protein